MRREIRRKILIWWGMALWAGFNIGIFIGALMVYDHAPDMDDRLFSVALGLFAGGLASTMLWVRWLTYLLD